MNTNQDDEQLRLLSIFHYVVAGILAVFSMFPILHLVFGIAIISGAFEEVDKGIPPPAFLGWIFVISASIFILGGLVMAAGVAIAGRRLASRQSYTYCLVIAAIECMFFPFGTALGVFTIIVLMRATVKEMFGIEGLDESRESIG